MLSMYQILFIFALIFGFFFEAITDDPDIQASRPLLVIVMLISIFFYAIMVYCAVMAAMEWMT